MTVAYCRVEYTNLDNFTGKVKENYRETEIEFQQVMDSVLISVI